ASPKRITPSEPIPAAPPTRHALAAPLQRLKTEADGGTVCQIRNVRVGSRRTTLRLEAAFWDAFDSLCLREDTTVDNVLTDLESERRDEALTSMVRSYLIAYWRRRAGDS